VINLRGVIVPIIDLRIKFNLGEPSYDQFTVVIILNIGKRVMGAWSMASPTSSSWVPTTCVPRRSSVRFWTPATSSGLGTVDERMIIVVDIER
jgi:purine-binding chemotaxis protein CheW